MSIDHWMMFATFAEQRHFIYPSPTSYRGAIINGNMAAHAPEALAAFLLEKTGQEFAYIIDPLVHAFQHSPTFITDAEGKPKSSIQKLADEYKSPVAEIVGRSALQPRAFQNKDVLAGFVQRCLQFQSCRLADLMRDNDALLKYLDPEETNFTPYALVAPYFYMDETTYQLWLPVMRQAIELAKETDKQNRIFGAVVVSQGVILNPRIMEEIARELNAAKPNGYLLWVDNLDEQAAGGAELQGLLQLAKMLRDNGEREVINLHGGYFSVLAAGVLGTGRYFTGVTHGPEFGEYRSVVPVGGGIPISRYYIPKLHARVKYRDAVPIFGEKGWLDDAPVFHKNVCNCDECRATLSGNIKNFTAFGESVPKLVPRRGGAIVRIDYPTTAARKHCLQHYLQRKAMEYQLSATGSEANVLADLKSGVDDFADVIGLEGVSHLHLWARAFGKTLP